MHTEKDKSAAPPGKAGAQKDVDLTAEINGTFMRYQMTHQIHLAVFETPHALNLALESTVAGTELGYSPPASTWPATPPWSAC